MKISQMFIGAVLLAFALRSTSATVEMTVNGLVCAFCAQGIEKKLMVAVTLKAGQDITDADLRKALTDSGYAAKAIDRTSASIAQVRERLKEEKP